MGTKLPAFVGPKGTIDTPAFYEGQVGWGNHSMPDVYVLDVNPNYPIGTKFVDGERTFMYGYVNAVDSTATKVGHGMCNIDNGQVKTSVATAHAVGTTAISVGDTTSAANQWAGGYMMCRTHPTITYRITENAVQDGTNTTFTIDRGLVVQIAASQTIRMYQNQYKKLCATINAGRNGVSFMGVNMVPPVASRYMWIQTWGPVNVLGGDEVPGSSAYTRSCLMNVDGTLIWGTGWDSAAHGGQYIGTIINYTTADNGANYTASWFVDLRINR